MPQQDAVDLTRDLQTPASPRQVALRLPPQGIAPQQDEPEPQTGDRKGRDEPPDQEDSSADERHPQDERHHNDHDQGSYQRSPDRIRAARDASIDPALLPPP